MAETYKTLGTLIYRDDGSPINKDTAANLDARFREYASSIDGAVAEAGESVVAEALAAADRAEAAAASLDGLKDAVDSEVAQSPADSAVAAVMSQPGTRARAALEDVVGLVQEDGHVKHEAVKIGRTQLDFLYGNGGDRVQLRGIPGIEAVDGKPAPMPYFEVRGAREGEGTDIQYAIGGYQAHWVGDGTTPSNQPRSYWFVELKDRRYIPEGHEEAAGFVGIGTSFRGGETNRSMSLHAGGRVGSIFHGVKPFIEITRNTGLLFDDRQRGTYAAGTVHQGTLINMRREGQLVHRMASVGDGSATYPTVALTRRRGTVQTPTDPANGDTLGRIDFGAASWTDPEKQHQDTHRTSAAIRAVMRQDWTDAQRGTRLEVLAAPNGSSSAAVIAAFQASGLIMDHTAGTRSSADPTADGTMISLRRDGNAHIKVEAVGSATAPSLRLARSGGTVANPAPLKTNEAVGEVDFGSTTGGTDPSTYTHRSAGGVRLTMREDWTDAARGSKVEIMATEKGKASRQVVATLQVPDQSERTGLLILARGADGTLGTREVLVGPRDSAGAGYMTLRIQNLPA